MACIFAALLFLGSLALPAATFASDDKTPLSVEALWSVQRVGALSLAPDGRWAAVDVSSYDMEANKSSADVWLLPTDPGEDTARQLTAHEARDGSPRWSPDGGTLLFLSKREGDTATQIYLIDPAGGEARRLTRIATGVAAPKWFPDGRQIAFISWVWPELGTDTEQAARLQEQKNAKVKVHITEATGYRHWDHWLADGRAAHLFVVDVETGACRDLMAGSPLCLYPYANSMDLSADLYDIAPDGNEVAFVVDSTPERGLNPNGDILVLATGGGEPRNITAENRAEDGNPAYSPDGRWLAYTRQSIARFSADRERVVLYERARGSTQVLTESWELSAGALTWSPDSKALYFLAEERARRPLWRLALLGGAPQPVVGGGTLTDFALSGDGKTLAFVRFTMQTPGRVFSAAADGKGPRRIESFNDALTSRWRLGQTKEMTLAGWGGEPVQMWVVYPPDFDPGKKWPLLQMVHGGPHGAVLDQFHYRWNLHVLASRGHVVTAVNFHGSTGWGPKFTDANTADYGTKELFDIEKGTDVMLATGYIDAARLAAAGGSFGGYMVAWMNGHTERYKAFVCHAGVFDWVPQQAASDVNAGRDRALGGFYWENPEQVHEQSARAHAMRFRTPTLVLHGERDFRVPVTQGLAYYGTLRNAGVPARLVYFEDENHWISKPQSARLWHQEVFAWLERYAPGGGR